MIRTEYTSAAAEALSVLENVSAIDVKKIPQSFLDFLIELSSKEDRPKLDYSKTIDELNLKEKTKEILGYIYINWWSTKEEKDLCKKIIDNKRKSNRVSANAIYDVNDMLKNRKNDVLVNSTKNTEIKEMVEYKQESFGKRIINKILSFFNRDLRRQ